MSLVKRIAASRPVQKSAGVVAAEYLRLVWMTTRFVMEPEDFFEQVELDVPVIIGKWHGQHFLMPFIRTFTRKPHKPWRNSDKCRRGRVWRDP